MDRRLQLVIVLGLVAAACTRGPQPEATGTRPPASTVAPTTPASPSPSPPTSPTPEAQIQLPEDAPTTFAEALAPQEVPVEELIPPGAQATSTWALSPPDDPMAQIGVAWARGADPFAQEQGLVVWQPSEGGAPWRAVYGFTDSPDRGVLGIRLVVDDLTGDGVDDALTFEDQGGSGACGIWRVIQTGTGTATQIYRRHTCDTNVTIGEGSLVVTASVYEPGDSHCCPSATRTTTLRWDGSVWQVVDRVTIQN